MTNGIEMKTCEPVNERELNILEEIEALQIDESTKNRIHKKAMDLVNANRDIETYLRRCHGRINRLEKAVVYLAMNQRGVGDD